MGFIEKIKNFIRNWFTQRALRKNPRKIHFSSYEKALTFGVMYDATEEKNYQLITHLVRDLQQDKKQVKTLGFVNQKIMPEYCFPKLTFEFANRKSFSWNLQIKEKNVAQFIEEQYDVLLDLTPSKSYQIKYLMATSQSKFKVGRYAHEQLALYDLLLQVDDAMPLDQVIKNTFLYLKMLNNGKSR